MRISREQVRGRITAAGWRFKDRSKSNKTEVYRKTGTTRRVFLPRRDLFEEKLVELVLAQAGLTTAEIRDFIAHATKS